jgi:hypothetical protein
MIIDNHKHFPLYILSNDEEYLFSATLTTEEMDSLGFDDPKKYKIDCYYRGNGDIGFLIDWYIGSHSTILFKQDKKIFNKFPLEVKKRMKLISLLK